MAIITECRNRTHYARIHPKRYDTQPQGQEMGMITNYMKSKGSAVPIDIEQLFNAFSSGQSVVLANYEIDVNNSIRFVSSSIFAIDVDDENEKTNPLNVLDDLKEVCTGLFYTFSHGVKGNRYRLVFQLDRAITNELDYKILVQYVMDQLKAKGLPVDEAAKNPTSPIRTGVQGHIVNNFNTKIHVNELLPKAKRRYERAFKEKEELRQKALQENMKNPLTFEELKELCQAIGHIPSGQGYETTQKWLQVVYSIKYLSDIGVITDTQGYELFNIVSGNESTEKYWQSIKPAGHVTVGTLIYHAQKNGYKFKNSYRYARQEQSEKIEIETINTQKYLTKEIATDLLARKERLLVDSPTGSGKTTAFMNSFKELQSNKHDYFIFAAPTIVLSEQIAEKHAATCIKGGLKNTKHDIVKALHRNERIFICTYDKTSELCSIIEEYTTRENVNFYIVVDEIHKYTEAYNYRFSTIDDLKQVSQIATSFIGLTGTPDDVLKDDYNKLIKIRTGFEKSPCTDYRVFTYDRIDSKTKMIDSGNRLLISVIEAMLKQTKVMVFINNTERIKLIARLLKNAGIKTSIVTSATKQSTTYQSIVESGGIAEDIQVVLTTVVLSDGISIDNSLNWSCLVVNDNESPIFNPSTIKQISNRFRNKYRYFALYMRTPNSEYNDIDRFYMQAAYKYRHDVAENYVKGLNEEYDERELENFIPSTVERSNGIYYKSSQEGARIEFNPLFLRHGAMKDKENYYKLYRNAFIQEVGRLIGHKVQGVYNVNEAAKRENADLSALLEEIQEETEKKKIESNELRSQFIDYFDEQVYLALYHQDDEMTLIRFKENVHPDQYSATIKNVKIASYETCLKLGQNVKRKADINSYYKDVEALTHIAIFHQVKKRTVTKVIYTKLLDHVGESYTTNDFKQLEADLSKKVKFNKKAVTKKDVKEALKLFDTKENRNKNERMKALAPLTIESVAKKYGISEDEVKKSILMYVDLQPKQRRKIMLESVKKEYQI